MARIPTVMPDGPAIRRLRKQRGLSVVQLARLCGADRHPQSVRKVETARGKPVGDVFIHQIANALKVDVADLICRDPEPDDDEQDEAA